MQTSAGEEDQASRQDEGCMAQSSQSHRGTPFPNPWTGASRLL